MRRRAAARAQPASGNGPLTRRTMLRSALAFRGRDPKRKGPLRRILPALALCLLAAAVVTLIVSASATETGYALRERTFDLLLPAAPNPSIPVVVVDIDETSLARVGPWPWPHLTIARLMRALAEAEPAVVALDILLAEPDRQSPAALARLLEAATERPLGDDLGTLADGDSELAQALATTQAVLALALTPRSGPVAARPPPLIVRGAVDATGWWRTNGLEVPIGPLADAASGLGIASLVGGPDGAVRHAPLLALAAGTPFAGLALESVRAARGGSAYLLDQEAGDLQVGAVRMPFGERALLRLAPAAADRRRARRVPAHAVLDGDIERLAGAIVIVGSSAPEAGGLRSAADGALVPSVDLQADAVTQLLTAHVPVRPPRTLTAERAASALGAALALLAATLLPPLLGSAAILAYALAWAGGAALMTAHALVLVDPLAPAAATLATFILAALLVAQRARRRAARVQNAFGQHLAPAVVKRIADNPDALRLEGEERLVAALFTDVEGFTTMSAHAEPQALIAVLDAYFDEMSRIAVEHDAMVAKFIGDSMHALFNVPVDLPDFDRRAVACARALAEAAERFCDRPDAEALNFGRTRIGLESGRVVVGDIGGARKLDYTAHGPAVSAAARFEAANKRFGTTICIGPTLASRLEPGALMPLATVNVRGLPDPQRLFTVWPDAMDAVARDAHLAKFEAAAATVRRLEDIDPAEFAVAGTAALRGKPIGA